MTETNDTTNEETEPQPLTRADLASLTPAEIIKLHQDGALDHLTGRTPRATHDGPLTREDLKHLTPAEIVAQHKAGGLAHLL